MVGWRVSLLLCFLAGVGVAAQPPQSPGRTLKRSDVANEPTRRVALVVGVDTYTAATPLKNARNDARAMQTVLQELRFNVALVEDPSLLQLRQAIAKFSEGLREDDLALFYFAGHGLQHAQENYLLSRDYAAGSVDELVLGGAVKASEVHGLIRRAAVGILVLDACRTLALPGARTTAAGLATMQARGTVIAYAAGAGETASDNPSGGNGLFTKELVTALKEPGLSLRDIFIRTRERVYAASQQRQFPALYEALIGNPVLRPGSAPVPPVPPPTLRGHLLIDVDTDANVNVNGNDLGVVKARSPRAVDVPFGDNVVVVRTISGGLEERRTVAVGTSAQQVVSFALATRAAEASRAQTILRSRQRFDRALNERDSDWIKVAQAELTYLRSVAAATPADESRLQQALAGVMAVVTLVHFESDASVEILWRGSTYRLSGGGTRSGDDVKLSMPLGRHSLQLRMRNSFYRTNHDCTVTIDVVDPDESENEYEIETERGCNGFTKK